MTGFPPGEWSFLLVGDQWPDDQDLMALSHGKLNRGQVQSGFMHFADMLRNAQTGPLAGQQGHTADDLRDAFCQGEKQARRVADKNGVKESAYSTAYDSTVGLQHDLTSVAEEGNKQIKEIQDSKQPLEAKVTQIVGVIQQSRALAALASAKCSGNVLEVMQRILDEEGTGQSARKFAQAHGVDVGQMFRQPDDQKNLSEQVKGFIEKPTGGTAGLQAAPPSAGGQVAPAAPASSGGLTPSLTTGTPSAGGQVAPAVYTAPGGLTPSLTTGTPSAGGQVAPAAPISAGGLTPAMKAAPSPPPPPPPVAGLTPSAPTSLPGGTLPPGGSLGGNPTSGLPTAGAAPLTGPSVAAPSPPQALTPGELIHSFDKGLENGAPFTAPTSAIPAAQMSPPAPHVAQSVPMGPSADLSAQAHAPVFDSPPPVTHTPVPDASAAPSVVAGPAASAGPVSATPPTGPLPAYASDLRPTISAATTPAAPLSSPISATPGSAPVHPSAGQGNPAQPAVVRQSAAPAQPPGASSLGTQAVTATATGAIAGAASANATARARLQRLIGAVARQQPRLAWAIGDRSDSTTVLATDLASGWIPPGIDLPAGVTLLPPERRRGSLEILLGDVDVAAGYTPIHHIPDEDEPVPTSARPRHVPEIDELGWELSQAVQWRDGLPRLALTLAKAASGGTGVLDKEVELLHEYLAGISTRVLDAYPDDVDTHEVGNWQLLAAIDALVAGGTSAATYHLAWFQACSATVGQAQSR